MKSLTKTVKKEDIPIIFGHRGISSQAPENSMDAFRLARELGAVELDVQLSSDGVVMIYHDDYLTRVGLDRSLHTMTSKELKALDVAPLYKKWGVYETPCPMPSLEELFAELGQDLFFDIELKGGWRGRAHRKALAKGVLELVEQYHMSERVIVSSFDPRLLLAWRKISNIPVAQLWEERKGLLRNFQWLLGTILLRPQMIKPPRQEYYHKDGSFSEKRYARWAKKWSLTWTEDNPDMQEALLTHGVRVIANKPISRERAEELWKV